MELIRLEWSGSWDARARYALLDRVARKCREHAVRFLGFGLGCDAALLVDGRADAVARVIRAVRIGNARDAGSGDLIRARRLAVYDAFEALVELHHTGGDPLANPWSSHRDLLGFRAAPFFEPAVWAGRARARHVHSRLGATPIPRRRRLSLGCGDLRACTRVAAAVLGRLPGHRATHRLAIQLARSGGLRQTDVAAGLLLSTRHVRSLERQREPMLERATACMADPRLRIVP